MKAYKLLTKNMTKLERLVVCMIFTEKLSLEETAYVLQVPKVVVQNIILDITDRLIK